MGSASGCSQRPEWLQEANGPHASGRLRKHFLEKAGGEMKDQGREKGGGDQQAQIKTLRVCVCVLGCEGGQSSVLGFASLLSLFY